MYERRSSIHSDTKSDDDELLSPVTTTSDAKHERILLNTFEEPITGIISSDENESDAEPLLEEIGIESSVPRTALCTNAPARYVIAIWAFFGFFCIYAMRVNLSVAIVAMVAPESALNHSVRACPVPITNSTAPPPKYEFQWSPNIEGHVLGAFFYGYVIMQVIAGNIAEKFGAKWIFGGGILIAGLLTLLTPLAARTHYGLLIAIRILIGLVEGPGYPSGAALWGKWIPPAERSTIPPAAQAGSNFGIIFSTPLISVMIEENFLGGWPSAFYVFGTLSCLWFVGWCFFAFNSPDEHPRISRKERIFLSKHITKNTHKNKKTPWHDIARCPSVYGIAIIHICNNYIYYTLLTSLPTYFSTILNFNLHQNGFLFAIPYFAQFLVTIIFGQIVDRIRARKLLSITVLRKAQAIIGAVGSSAFLISIGYMGCNHVGAVVCCVFAVAFLGFHSCGPLISHLDIASNYAGTLMGITNSLAAIPGFIGPYVVGAITNNNQTIHAWRVIFNISAGIGAFGCVAYCILFNGEEKAWNKTAAARERNESTMSIDT